MPPQIREHLPQVDLRLDVRLGSVALWDLLLEVVVDHQHVQIARSGPDHLVLEVLARGGRHAGEFEIRWAPVAAGVQRVRSSLVARLVPRSKLPWVRQHREAVTHQRYRTAMQQLEQALRPHEVAPIEPVRPPLIDPELVRRAASAFAPLPPARSTSNAPANAVDATLPAPRATESAALA